METQNTKSMSSAEGSSSAKPAAVPDILLKKQCEHTKCPHHRCERKDLRIGGIDI